MTEITREEMAARIRQILEEDGENISRNTRTFNQGRYDSVSELSDYDKLKDQARAIKEDAIARLPELLAELEETVEANGGTVYLADDAADATEYMKEVAADVDAETLVKSKSMTSEELGVNEALSTDVDVWETDMAEFVLQIADEAPSHLIAPAIHKSQEEIAELFTAYFDLEEPLETAEELTRFTRELLWEHIAEADIGMTGANFVTADTGTIALVGNEGNIRKTAVTPPVQIAVTGVEKILPTVGDLPPFIELISRSGSGRDITSYVSLLSPPVDSPVIDFESPDTPLTGSEHDREFHLVLIDNGRMEMREDDDLMETLYCIRCSACLNSCANFQAVGGHVFGGETYSGGIGTGWEAGVHGLESTAEFNDLCTGCSRCVDQCPVKIDIPWINTVVRDRLNQGADPGKFASLYQGLLPDDEPAGLDLQKRFFGNFNTVAKLGSAFAPVSNIVANATPTKHLLQRTVGIDPRRELPQFRRETLCSWFRSRDTPTTDGDRSVVLYPDLYTNYIDVSRGKAAVKVLESFGVDVMIPAVGESGRAPLSQGMIATARSRATAVSEALEEPLKAKRDIVVIEPSDLAMIRREYERLLPAEDYTRLASQSYDLLEYIYGLVQANGGPATVEGTSPESERQSVAYHSHCQQRTLGLAEYTVAVLEAYGYDVVTSDVECCGMAGSFGYKSEYYDLSMTVGEMLVDDLIPKTGESPLLLASGTSCKDQLDALFNSTPYHPIELLAGQIDG